MSVVFKQSTQILKVGPNMLSGSKHTRLGRDNSSPRGRQGACPTPDKYLCIAWAYALHRYTPSALHRRMPYMAPMYWLSMHICIRCIGLSYQVYRLGLLTRFHIHWMLFGFFFPLLMNFFCLLLGLGGVYFILINQ